MIAATTLKRQLGLGTVFTAFDKGAQESANYELSHSNHCRLDLLHCFH